MPTLVCPLCGHMQDARGPGVGSTSDPLDNGSTSYWIPFIEDLRGTPRRLVHPQCFAEENGVDHLVRIVTEHDEKVRSDHQRRKGRPEQ